MHNRSSAPRPETPSVGAAPLRSTAPGTARFRQRFADQFTDDFFRPTTFGLTASAIGLGSYLGDNTDAEDAAYERAVRRAIQSGINLFDTAINYRCQRSERSIGSALQHAFAAGDATRDELVICSKGGYIPLDRTPPATREDYREYLQREFIDPQILHADDIVVGGHSLAPRFLRYCLAKSRQNLGLRTIDVYYLHNPEQQLGVIDPAELRDRLRAAFVVLEEAESRGEIGGYGCATWDALRVPPGARGHLSLEDLVQLAREAGGEHHHFRAVQLPINLAMMEGVRADTQPLGDRLVSVATAAEALGVTVVGSASLMQGRLTRDLPDAIREHFPQCETDAQRALAFVRSLPGVTASLVGMKSVEHVDTNLDAARRTSANR